MVMVRNNQDYKYEPIYKGLYNVIHACTNVTITPQIVTKIDKVKICRIKPCHLEEFS